MARARQLKPKKCKAEGCGETFSPWSSLQKVCSPMCAIAFANQEAARKYRAETREMKRKFNETDRTYQTKKAREACHRYILKRDEREGCISCGIETGKMEAGHYKTVGHAPELRFTEDNIHKQCSQCNNFKSGNIPGYRVGLVKKIGEARVAHLERSHPPQNLTIEDLKDIQWWYKQKLRWLQGRK